MQNLLQQYGPAVTGKRQLKPVTHGDSGTRSQLSSLLHSAVHRPLFAGGGVPPGGSSRVGGWRRQIRDSQSSDGDATNTSVGGGCAVPRSQIRPTGLSIRPEQPAPSAAIVIRTTSTASWCRIIANDGRRLSLIHISE